MTRALHRELPGRGANVCLNKPMTQAGARRRGKCLRGCLVRVGSA